MSDSELPWGRTTLPNIPLPPFSGTERRAFIQALQTWIALLRDRPTLDAYALSEWLQSELNPPLKPRRTSAEWRSVDRVLLRLAIWTLLPAPWTPHAIASALADAHPGIWATRVDRYGDISWGSDPDYRAHREQDGSWTVTRFERGSTRVDATPASDDDMVLLLESHEHAFPYPYGWKTDEAAVAAMLPLADETKRAWSVRAGLPYIQSWLDELNEKRAN